MNKLFEAVDNLNQLTLNESDKPYIRRVDNPSETMTKEEVHDEYEDWRKQNGWTEEEYSFDDYLRDVDETQEWELIESITPQDRDIASDVLAAVEDGFLTYENVAVACLKWMSSDDIKAMIKANDWAIADDEMFDEAIAILSGDPKKITGGETPENESENLTEDDYESRLTDAIADEILNAMATKDLDSSNYNEVEKFCEDGFISQVIINAEENTGKEYMWWIEEDPTTAFKVVVKQI